MAICAEYFEIVKMKINYSLIAGVNKKIRLLCKRTLDSTICFVGQSISSFRTTGRDPMICYRLCPSIGACCPSIGMKKAVFHHNFSSTGILASNILGTPPSQKSHPISMENFWCFPPQCITGPHTEPHYHDISS